MPPLPRSLTAAAFRGGEAGCASESELEESELELPDDESSESESEEPLLLLSSLEELQAANEIAWAAVLLESTRGSANSSKEVCGSLIH